MNSSLSRRERLDLALREFALTQESGAPFNRTAFLARFREVRNELATLLGDIQSLDQLGQNLLDEIPPMIPGHLEPGDAIGDFLITRELGAGSQGRVFEAIQESLGRRVAIKVFTDPGGFDPRWITRFTIEAKTAARLVHDHIVPVHSTGSIRGCPYLCMALMEGGSVASRAGQWTSQQIARMGREIASALAYSHREGVIHRDIKPANLLLDRKGRVHLADFGLALSREATCPNGVSGTLSYLCPELIRNPQQRPDGRGDIYSLGVTLYVAVTGIHPFCENGSAPRLSHIMEGRFVPLTERKPGLPVDFCHIIHKAMASDPRDRYATAEDLMEDWDRFLAGLPVRARPLSLLRRSWRWAGRHRSVLLATGVCIALGMAGSWYWAESQTAWAERNRELAERDSLLDRTLATDAIKSLVDIAAQLRHQPGQSEKEREILREFLEKIEEPCSQLGPEHPLRAEQAIIQHILAKLESSLGDAQVALGLFVLAKSNLTCVVENQPQAWEAARELAEMHQNESEEWLDRDPQQALERSEESERLLRKALEIKPSSGSVRNRLIWLWLHRIRLHAHGDQFEEGRLVGNQALELCEELLREYPSGHPLSYSRPALVWHQLAHLEKKAGNLPAMDQAFERALAWESQVRHQFPGQYHLLGEGLWEISIDAATDACERGQHKKAALLLSERKEWFHAFLSRFSDRPVACPIRASFEKALDLAAN